jgi:hypothetical protein
MPDLTKFFARVSNRMRLAMFPRAPARTPHRSHVGHMFITGRELFQLDLGELVALFNVCDCLFPLSYLGL